jgi:hypothetical protein
MIKNSESLHVDFIGFAYFEALRHMPPFSESKYVAGIFGTVMNE